MKFFLFMRPLFWLPAIGSTTCGYLFILSDVKSIFHLLLLIILIGPGIAAFSEMINDLYDKEKDKISKKYYVGRLSLAGGSGILSDGKISRNQAKLLCLISAVIALSIGFYFGLNVLLFSILGLLVALFYSIPKIRGKENIIVGQILLALGYGPISFFIGFYAIKSRFINFEEILVSSIIGLWVVTVGIIADVLDIQDNSKLGIKNLAVILGKKNSIIFSVIGSLMVLILTVIFNYLMILQIRYLFFMFLLVLVVVRSIILLKDISEKSLMQMHIIAIILETIFPITLYSK